MYPVIQFDQGFPEWAAGGERGSREIGYRSHRRNVWRFENEFGRGQAFGIGREGEQIARGVPRNESQVGRWRGNDFDDARRSYNESIMCAEHRDRRDFVAEVIQA